MDEFYDTFLSYMEKFRMGCYFEPLKVFRWIQNYKNNSKAECRWCEIFKILVKNNIPIQYVMIISEYSLAIPGTNASVERVFSN
jgi:hypothetical protein